MPDPKDALIRRLSALPLLGALSAEQLHDLAARCRVRDLDRGQVLFSQGDCAQAFFLVMRGWVRVFRLSPQGQETVLHVVPAGETFAEPAALTIGHYPASAQAASDAAVCAIPAADFRMLLADHPQLALHTIGVLAQRMHRLVTDFDRLNSRSSAQRLAQFLLERLADDNPTTVALPYDKGLLAARLGMTPETLSRSFAKLKNLGVTSRGARITIGDSQRLQHYAESGSAQ